jgi:hypothetical protein
MHNGRIARLAQLPTKSAASAAVISIPGIGLFHWALADPRTAGGAIYRATLIQPREFLRCATPTPILVLAAVAHGAFAKGRAGMAGCVPRGASRRG